MTFRTHLLKLLPILFIISFDCLATISNYSNSDPYPMYSTLDPQDFLTANIRSNIKKMDDYLEPTTFSFEISVFRQIANRGTDFEKRKTELGNLLGPWNIVGFFYDPIVAPKLVQSLGLTDTFCINFIENQDNTDSRQKFGFFSVPIRYRKQGLRFQAEMQFTCDLGLCINLGVADLRQTVSFVDLTCFATALTCLASTPTENPGPDTCPTDQCCDNAICCVERFDCQCKKMVIKDIMNQICTVAKTVGIDINDFHKVAMEDPRIGVYYRHVYEINATRTPRYPHFLITPFFFAQIALPFSNEVKPGQVFGLSAGNNGHAAFGFTGGVNLDFVDTVAIGFEVGMTAFSSRQYPDYRMPTTCLQSGVFPRGIPVKINPGTNWQFAAELAAYHFLDRLSFFAQYVMISHGQDHICPLVDDPAFLIRRAQELTKWEDQVINSALYYDLSPNITVGFLWQAPVNRRNAYRANTIMASIVASF